MHHLGGNFQPDVIFPTVPLSLPSKKRAKTLAQKQPVRLAWARGGAYGHEPVLKVAPCGSWVAARHSRKKPPSQTRTVWYPRGPQGASRERARFWELDRFSEVRVKYPQKKKKRVPQRVESTAETTRSADSASPLAAHHLCHRSARAAPVPPLRTTVRFGHYGCGQQARTRTLPPAVGTPPRVSSRSHTQNGVVQVVASQPCEHVRVGAYRRWLLACL